MQHDMYAAVACSCFCFAIQLISVQHRLLFYFYLLNLTRSRNQIRECETRTVSDNVVIRMYHTIIYILQQTYEEERKTFFFHLITFIGLL